MKNSSTQRLRSTPSKKLISHPKGILVLGMHRSGTSAFTRVLNLLGCALPDSLIGGGEGNEAGHWEAISVVTLNDQIFTSAGSRWDDWGPLNDDWRQSSLRDDMLQKAVVLIEEHADLGSLFAIKDPRLCRVADVWLAAMEEAKVEPSAVLMVRNPAEVIASLESRDLMAPGYSQLLWLRHALDAEFFSRGSNRVICRYDQLMSNWFSVIDRVRTGLGITLPRNSPSVHLEIEQYLNDEHRHHEIPLEAVIGNPALSDWLRRTFAIMMNWSEEGERSSDYAELDQIRLEFDRSYSTFARLLLPGDLTGGAGLGPSIKRELTAAQQALQNAEIASQETETRLAAATSRVSQMAVELAEAQKAAQAAQTASQETETRLAAATSRVSQMVVELAEAQKAANDRELLNAELVGRLAVSESTIIQRQEELSQLITQFRETERALAQSVTKAAVAEEQLLVANQRVAEGIAQIKISQDACELAEDSLAWQKEKASQLETQLGQEQASKQSAESARALAEHKLGDRFAEIARLTGMLADESAKAAVAEEALAAQQNKTNQLDAEFKQLQVAKDAAESARAVADQKVADRFAEIARLTSILADEGTKVDQAQANAEWLRSALQLAAHFPKWWAIMPQKWRRKREHARYRNSGLLDAERYLEAYPDVAEYGMDPVRHYILHGMGEGRNIAIE